MHRQGVKISRNKVYKIMKEHDLLVKQKEYKAKRTSQRSKPKADKPNQYWGIDATKFMVSSVGWVYLIIVLDWYTKQIVGWNVSLRNRTKEWSDAIEMAVTNEFSNGVRNNGLNLISDNGSQPASCSFMETMHLLDINQIFTSYDNPKGNADTERMIRTVKEEIIWLNEFSSLQDAKETINDWIPEQYNKLYPHSAIGYLSPIDFKQLYYENSLPNNF